MSVILGNIPQFRWNVKNGNRFVPVGVNVGIGNPDPIVGLEVGVVNATFSDIGIVGSLAGTLSLGGVPTARLYIQGSNQADIMFDNSGGDVNQKLFQFINQGGQLRYRSLNDAGGVVCDPIFGMMSDGTTQIGGSLIFLEANKGLICGQFGQENIPTTVAVGAVDTDYVVNGMTNLIDNRLIFQNNKEYKVETKGFYLCIWGLSIQVAAGGKEIEGAVGLNGAKQPLSSGHRTIANPNDSGHIGGVGLVDCAVNDLLSIVVRNNTDTQNIIVNHANLYVQQVLGT